MLLRHLRAVAGQGLSRRSGGGEHGRKKKGGESGVKMCQNFKAFLDKTGKSSPSPLPPRDPSPKSNICLKPPNQ